MGVSVVRRMGPGVSLHSTGAGRSGFRQGATDSSFARMVHAPQRPIARLRVVLQRRESAGTRLGGVARLQNRAARARSRGPRIPGKSFSQAASEFYLVGEPQGSGWREYLPGRI